MKGHRPQTIRALIGLALGVGVTHFTYAASLGPIQVNSYMGQPLNAAIRVNGLTPAQAQGASVTLADGAEYSKRGVVKTPEQSSLAFRLVPSGNAYTIAVSSAARMNDPFVNFVLTFRSGAEVHTREYSVFLDPDPAAKAGIAPAVVNVPPAQAVAQPMAAPNPTIQAASPHSSGWGDVPPGAQRVALHGQTIANEPIASAQPASAPKARAAATQQAHANSARISGNRYGPVGRGETLYSIANATRPSNVSVQTMMRAIFNANRRAFANNSMDSLMAGQTLVIPSNPSASSSSRRSSANADSEETRPADQRSRQAEAKTGAQIADVITSAANEEDVRPVEMSAEEIAAAEAEAAKLAAEQSPNAETAETAEIIITESSQTTEAENDLAAEQAPSADANTVMALDDVNSIDATNENLIVTSTEELIQEAQNEPVEAAENTAEQELNPQTPNMPEPAVPPAQVEEAVVSEMPAQEAEPVAAATAEPQTAAAEPQKPANTLPLPPPAAPIQEDEGFLFGLPLWAIASIGGLLIALLALAGLAAAKKRRAAAGTDMSEEEIQALADSMDEAEEQRLAALIEEDELENDSSLSLNKVEQSDYDNTFFANDESSDTAPDLEPLSLDKSSQDNNDETQLDALDDFFADADAQVQNHSQHEISATQIDSQSFEGLDDFFADVDQDPQPSQTHQKESVHVSTDVFDDVEDFFIDTDSDADAKAGQSSPLATADDEVFDDLDLFLSDDTLSEDTHEAPALMEDDFAAIDTESLDFFADSSIDEEKAVEEEAPAVEEDSAVLDALSFMDEDSGLLIDEQPRLETEDASEDIAAFEVPDFDAPEEEAPVEKASVSEADIEAMSINLDLAAAYINSGIKPEKVAKVRAWLEEVLERGNDEQGKIAQELMAKLPS